MKLLMVILSIVLNGDISLIISDSAMKAYAPIDVMKAICYVESGYRPKVINEFDGGSPSYGLCQVKKHVAMMYDNHVTLPELLDAKYNSYIASKYFSYLLFRFNGNIEYAIAAYNAGPTKVSRWLRNHGKYFNKDYVNKVLYTMDRVE